MMITCINERQLFLLYSCCECRIGIAIWKPLYYLNMVLGQNLYNDVLIRNTFNFVRIGLRVLPFSRAMILKSWTAFRK